MANFDDMLSRFDIGYGTCSPSIGVLRIGVKLHVPISSSVQLSTWTREIKNYTVKYNT